MWAAGAGGRAACPRDAALRKAAFAGNLAALPAHLVPGGRSVRVFISANPEGNGRAPPRLPLPPGAASSRLPGAGFGRGAAGGGFPLQGRAGRCSAGRPGPAVSRASGGSRGPGARGLKRAPRCCAPGRAALVSSTIRF